MNNKEKVIEELLALGWEHDGFTTEQRVRIPTKKVPLYGKSGGELATFGGRVRLTKRHWKVTVGKITTFFYTTNGTSNFRVPTKDIDDVLRIARSQFM